MAFLYEYKLPAFRENASYVYGGFAKRRLYVLTDLKQFLDEAAKKTERTANLIKLQGRYQSDTYMIVIGEEKYVEQFLALSPQIRFLFGGSVIPMNNLSPERLYEIFSAKVSSAIRGELARNSGFKAEFLEYVAMNRKRFPLKNREFGEYLAEYANNRASLVLPPETYHKKSAKDLLDSIVGMKNVKEKAAEFEAYAKFLKRAESIGVTPPNNSLHMVFTGNPGTGKTMAARIIGQMLYDLDLVKEPTVKEVDAKDLKAPYAKVVKYQQHYKKERGENYPGMNMHMVFTGNPGTGKTTIANLMADLLYDIGVLKVNKVVPVEYKDLVAEFSGRSAQKTSEVIERALDGILFIDEAYMLARDPNGAEAIATLITAMEEHEGDLIVIFAGYKDEMRRLVNSNPGIASRIGNTFDFPDYSSDELFEMYRRKLKKYKFTLSKKARGKAKDVLDYFSRRKNFGNGRFVKKLTDKTLELHAENAPEDKPVSTVISQWDIPSISDINNTPKPLGHAPNLDDVIGLKAVKDALKEFEDTVNFELEAKEKGKNLPDTNMHMIFTGNPGTGKTMMARIIAKYLYDIGVIMENKVVEVEAKDLIVGYVGQTAPKTAEQVEKALGGVLFVDEAYTLAPEDSHNNFGPEAIAVLVKAMEDHKDDLIVIFAGYENEMRRFENSNPGIASRIGFHFRFEDYNAKEIRQIFELKMKESGFAVSEKAGARLEELIQYFCNIPKFGNGRFVDKLIQSIFAHHARNFHSGTAALDVIDLADLPDEKEIGKKMNLPRYIPAPDDVKESERKRTAIHESGHALLRKKLIPEYSIEKISIRAEGTGTLGYVQYNPDSSGPIMRTKSQYKDYIAGCMAGLAAEKVFLGDYEDGGSSDIQHAAANAEKMITRLGMSKHGFAGPGTPEQTQQEINEILEECFHRAVQVIETYREQVSRMVERLLAGEELTDGDVTAIFAD